VIGRAADLVPGSARARLRGDHPPAEEHVVPFVNVKLVEKVFTERQRHEMAAKITDVMVAFEGSEAFREVVLVLIEELDRDGWQVGSIENARAAVAAGCDLMAAQGIESSGALVGVDGSERASRAVWWSAREAAR
jgi:phenylpyruvate tautomerase PptA (4-oxalocrotonate tautomerase family)